MELKSTECNNAALTLIERILEDGYEVTLVLDDGSKLVVSKGNHQCYCNHIIIQKPENTSNVEPITSVNDIIEDPVIKWIQDNTTVASTQQRVYKLYMAYMMSSNDNELTSSQFRNKLGSVHKVWKTEHNNWFTNAILKGIPLNKMDKIESVIDLDKQIQLIEDQDDAREMDDQ